MDRPTRLALRSTRLSSHLCPRSHLRTESGPIWRSIQTSSKRSVDQPPLTLQQLRQAKAAATSASGSGSSSGLVPLRQPWPWHAVSSSPERTILERTIYARPSDLNPTLLLFAAGVWGLFVFTYFALPDPRQRELTVEELAKIEEMEKKAKEAGFAARLGNKLAGTIFASSQPLLMGGVSIVLTGFMLGASRIITRLTMVQVRNAASSATATAAGVGEEARTIVRITSVGHEMWRGFLFKPREVELGRCRTYLLDSNRATTVRLKIVDSNGQSKRYSFDRFPYSLDFRPYKPPSASASEQTTTHDVVLSQNRLEHVFGPLRKGST